MTTECAACFGLGYIPCRTCKGMKRVRDGFFPGDPLLPALPALHDPRLTRICPHCDGSGGPRCERCAGSGVESRETAALFISRLEIATRHGRVRFADPAGLWYPSAGELILPNRIIEEMQTHAFEAKPREAFGLLGANGNYVRSSYRMESVEGRDPKFSMTVEDIVPIRRAIAQRGEQLLGGYCGVDGSTYPEDWDVAVAEKFGLKVYCRINSRIHSSLKAFQLAYGRDQYGLKVAQISQFHIQARRE